MPHCILEYSDNLLDAPDLPGLLNRIHARLLESGEFAPENLKSRAYEASDHCVGDGDPDRGFVALAVHILAGRDDATRAALAESVLPLLTDAFPASLATGKLDVSVRIVDMHRESYRKHGMTDL